MRGSSCLNSRRTPVLVRVLLIAAVSAAFTAALIHYSARLGRLVLYPQFDDVGYFYDAAQRTQVLYDHGPTAALVSWQRDPPHSPWSTSLASLSFLVFGMQDWAPYAGNAILIAILLLLVDHLLRGLRLWQKLLAFAFVLSVPLCSMTVTEFRPDAAAAIFTIAGAVLALDRPLLTASLRWRILVGACFGLAILAKPPTFPATIAMFLLTLALAGVLAISIVRTVRWRRLVPVVVAAVLVPLPHFLVSGRSILGYIHRTLYGEERERWVSTLSMLRRTTVYLFGDESGRIMLGRHVPFLLALVVLGSLAVIAGRRRISSRRTLAGGAILVVLLAAWAIATANHVVSLWFGVVFQFALLITSVVAIRLLVMPRPWQPVRSVFLIVATIAGLVTVQFPPAVGDVTSPREEARRRLVRGIYDAIVRSDPFPNSRIFVMGVGDVNATVLNFRAVQELRQRLSNPREPGPSWKPGLYFYTAKVEDGADISKRAAQWDQADYIIISERGTTLTEPSIPEYRILDDCIKILKARIDMHEAGYFRFSQTGKGFYIFQRQPFVGFEVTSGLGPHEGPNPEGNDPQVRWGLGPETILRVNIEKPSTLTLSLRNHEHADQVLEILADGRSIHVQAVSRSPHYSNLSIDLPAGTREVQFRYAKCQDNPVMPRAILFRRITIEPAP